MKFTITRTSTWYDKKPYKNAIEEEYINIWGQKQKEWVIEINTLEELLKLQKEEGDIIIKNDILGNNKLALEIYDTYRE